MNILLIGEKYNLISGLIQKSVMLDKLFVASNSEAEDAVAVKYSDIEDLAKKANALQIDIAVNTDNTLINHDIIEIFRKNKLSLISVNQKWLNLETSKMAAKQLMMHYSINVPKTIKLPANFPVVLRFESEKYTDIAGSMDELVQKLQENEGKRVSIEDYLDGEAFYLNVIWDGKNIFYFDIGAPLSEVQEDRLNLLKTKINFMFSDEKADFIGIFTISLVWAKNDWYVRDFYMGVNDKMSSENLSANKDFLYILNAAIYQKLDEI